MPDGSLEFAGLTTRDSNMHRRKTVAPDFLDIVALHVDSGGGKSDLVLYCERCSSLFSPSRLLRCHIALHEFIAR
jgi:hypothetical protein